MNPFKERAMPIDASFRNWSGIYPKPYCKHEVDPYTKCRIILMNGAEFESVNFGHRFHRICNNNDLRRELALIRRSEQQQQKVIAALKPMDESIIEHTISYEQLAVDLTAEMARKEPDMMVKAALDFALLEDFDHLYRYADLLEMQQGIKAEHLVGHYTEIMPGRPTISEHRYPFDNVRCFINNKTAHPLTRLHAAIITAAEQQTMNYYMNVAAVVETSDVGRQLYQEIGLIEEQHVTQYGSLLDPNVTLLEHLLANEYTECYLYYSCYQTETDPYIKKIWEQHFCEELSHLHKAVELLRKYEKKDWCEVIPNGEFPDLLSLHENKEYIRKVLENTVNFTSRNEDYICVDKLRQDDRFFLFQQRLNTPVCEVPSHAVIEQYIALNGMDYRYEIRENPIPQLRDRKNDNTTIGRCM